MPGGTHLRVVPAVGCEAECPSLACPVCSRLRRPAQQKPGGPELSTRATAPASASAPPRGTSDVQLHSPRVPAASLALPSLGWAPSSSSSSSASCAARTAPAFPSKG
eukprot:scaffold447_cov307-Pinguiococcus_pyrenoidosus.AAC.41